ncbi:hypothetical protein CBL_09311 [Carabus blaptoides fortunei]
MGLAYAVGILLITYVIQYYPNQFGLVNRRVGTVEIVEIYNLAMPIKNPNSQ